MFSDFLGRTVVHIHFASFVPPKIGKIVHTNRQNHGLVLNDPDIKRDYFFDDGRILHTEGNTLFYLPKGSSYRVKHLEGEGGCYAINFDMAQPLSVAPFMQALRAPENVRRQFKEADRA